MDATENSTTVSPSVVTNCSYNVVNKPVEPYIQAACFLSMIGSLLIVLTYVLFADLRTTSRRLLVFLSFMDFGTALSNSVGMFMNFQKTSVVCQVQAVFAIYCSVSSYLWTSAIAVYLYLTIVRNKQVLARALVTGFHVIAWGIPLIIVSVAAGLQVVGYDAEKMLNSTVAPAVTGGWCYIRGYVHSEELFLSSSDSKGPPHWYGRKWYQFWVMMAGGAWELATFLFCVVVYILIKFHLYREKQRSAQFITQDAFRVVVMVDRKLTFIPIVFFLLHVWSVVRDIARFDNNVAVTEATWLIALEGIGDSLQGAANGVMFCLFTAVVRDHLLSCIPFRRQLEVRVNENRPQSTDTERGSTSSSSNVVGTSDAVEWPNVGHISSGEEQPLVEDER